MNREIKQVLGSLSLFVIFQVLLVGGENFTIVGRPLVE